MDQLTVQRIISIGVVTVVIIIIQYFAKRFVRLSRVGSSGIYVMLLPVGYNCFGWDLHPYLVAAWVVAGLMMVLWGVGSRGGAGEE